MLNFLRRQLKYYAELRYWKRCLKRENGQFANNWYKDAMLLAAGETSTDFTSGQVIADFGCGPRGSLCWADKADDRIGIDVLADRYRHLHKTSQNMRYVRCSETAIPLPNDSVDILFTMNALDHASNLPAICEELRRILKPGGKLFSFINLGNEPTVAEPSPLNEALVQKVLLPGLRVLYSTRARRGNTGRAYDGFRDPELEDPSGPEILLIRAEKPENT
jgi:SAM-dependent methyltransferase